MWRKQRDGRPERLAYYAQYHIDHREHRKDMAAARWRAKHPVVERPRPNMTAEQRRERRNMLARIRRAATAAGVPPKRAMSVEERRQRRRNYLQANAFALKVVNQWHVPISVARTMIEQGSFPR